jgi:hypothetical protein
MRSSLLLLACLLLLRSLTLPARLAAAEAVDYLRDVKPILRERCYACHGPLKQKAKLRLDTAASLLQGGRSGLAAVPGQPERSRLLARVSAAEESERMPPEGKPLTPQQIAVLREWIRQGAGAPADEKPEEDPRRHWAFLPPVRPPVPAVKNTAWVRNPIDAFVAARHEQAGLTPAPPADQVTLLRRVYLDLVGLPPTREELHAFLADTSPDAYEKVVDRLLSSPRHAERWARHWMDVWRYSDWYGSRYINELRNSRRHIWRWRDWIIESLDMDKGYDRMVVEMLAGDEAAPGDLDVQRASGFLGRNFYVFNRNVWLQDTVEYTGMSLLGLTFKCCRCHDHKYDPLSQQDYYRFRAFFEPHHVRTDPLPGKHERIKGNIAANSPPGSEWKDGLDCVYDADVKAPTYLFERGNEKNPVKDQPIAPGVPAFLGGDLGIEPVTLPLEAFAPGLRPAMMDSLRAEAKAALQKAETDLAKGKGGTPAEKQVAAARAQLASLEARIAADLARQNTHSADPKLQLVLLAAAKAEREATLRQVEVELAQAEQQPTGGKAVPALKAKLAQAQKALAEAATAYTPLGPTYPPTSSGRRLALARWIAARQNPLTARVAVNHIWLRHLGSALVPSVSNFGRNGKRPTHPELLDWLAVELMERGWSMKHLHRLIVTSNTYRLASAVGEHSEHNRAVDAENRLLWRANVRRMEGEVVRDSLLHLAGRLDVGRGGEDLEPAQDHAIPRRSLYFRHTPDEKPLLLEVFDAANPSECFERTESVVPQQALALANGDFSHSQARLIARRLAQPALTDADFVTAAFEQVLCRPPHPEERVRCEAFLRQHAEQLRAGKGLTPGDPAIAASLVPPSADPALRARENLVHVLLNYNEFVTVR